MAGKQEMVGNGRQAGRQREGGEWQAGKQVAHSVAIQIVCYPK